MASVSPIQHVVILIKENHAFDNYFGTFPGATGASSLAHAPNPPLSDHTHTHQAWLNRSHNPVKQQYRETDIPTYFQYARQYTLCDNYFTDVAGPSSPNHLMLVTADSPIINNPHHNDPPRDQPPFNLPSLPANLEAAGLTWRNYGHYIFEYVTALKNSPHTVTTAQFAKDATAGNLPAVSWVFAPNGLTEHPTENVTTGMHWTAQQVDAVVKGGLWHNTAIFITWDDWGGWYDHVTPPNVEPWTDGTQFRYGSRVGCLVLSPFARAGYISKTLHSHVSLVKFCETTFGLPAINARDAAADDMRDCFHFTQTPLPAPMPSGG